MRNLRTIFILAGALLCGACFAQQTAGNITTFAGNGLGYSGDNGLATKAQLFGPDGLAVDKAGNVFIVDAGNHRIRKVDTSGMIATVAGNGHSGFAGDGGPATSAEFSWGFNGHLGIAVDGGGNLYIPDLSNQRVRKVDPAGNITTVAGNGTRNYTGDGGPATSASLVDPTAVAVDRGGNLYIAAGNWVRRVDTAGNISTYAGGGPLGKTNGDGGPATLAVLNAPFALAFDGGGNLYIGDTTARLIRKVDPKGTITTVAGNGSTTYSGDGGPATKAGFSLTGLAADSTGNLFIAESSNRVRKVNTSGIISTIAGTGAGGESGDGGPATSATLSQPGDVAVDRYGNVYIAETIGSRVREVFGAEQSALPAISAGGVVSASAFGEFGSVAPGSWIEIYGSNLAGGARSWSGLDFSGSMAPVALDGTSVTVGNASAYVSYISPTQVNVQVPSGIGMGPQPLVVSTSAGSSSPYLVTVNPAAPGLLAPWTFRVGGNQYVAAVFPDYANFAIPSGAVANVNSHPAKPGDTLIIFGVGFGEVSPAVPAGELVPGKNSLTAPFEIFFGGAQANVAYAGLAPGYVGLYQFNVQVPDVPAGDLVPLTFTLNGTQGAQTLYTAVGSQ